MKKLNLFIILAVAVTVLSGCNLKVNLNSNLNQSEVKVEPQAGNLNQPVNENLNQNTNASAEANGQYQIIAQEDKLVTEVKIGEVSIKDFVSLCGKEVMVYAEPKNGFIIFQAFNPGSEKPVSNLYSLDLNSKGCKKLEVSKELADFGARILSPDQTKLALALETKEAKELQLVDLIADTAKVLVTLNDGETLNGGYGALGNHFDIKWLDNSTIQYTVYEDTIKNFAPNMPENLEKVLQVRVVKVE